MHAICHIGLPKTGSTTIQNFLALNASALEDQKVIYRRMNASDSLQTEYFLPVYAKVRRNFDDPLLRNRFRLKTAADLDARAADITEWVDRQIKGSTAHTWLISNELISVSLIGQPGSTALHNWLAERFSSVTYVAYLRRQDQWIASRYSQHLRNGYSDTFADFVANAPGVNYLKLHERWARLAGRENVSFRLLTPDALLNGDLIDDFCDVIGVDQSKLKRPENLNQSMSAKCAEIVRKTNSLTERFLPRHGIPSRGARKVAEVVGSALFGRGPKHQVPDTIRDELFANHSASNEQVKQLCFPHREKLFDLEPRSSREPSKT